jgi:hypothetical protein
VLHETFWRPKKSAYVDAVGPNAREQVSQQTNALMLLAGACPREHRRKVAGRILDESDPGLCVAGPYFWTYISRALCRENMQREVLAGIRSRWGEMVEAGATTWWETFLGDELDSLCHAWSSMPNQFLLSEIAGVRPLRPAFGAIEIRPRPDLVGRTSARVPTPRGTIEVSWRPVSDGRCLLRCRVPEGLPAEVLLPSDWRFSGTGIARGKFQASLDEEIRASDPPPRP